MELVEICGKTSGRGAKMSGFLKNWWSLLILRILIGGIFIYAGIVKLQKPENFADSIATFHLLPVAGINLVALGLPLFEIIMGGLLLINRYARMAGCALTLLCAVFMLAFTQALLRGLPVDCRCFGEMGYSSNPWAFVFRDLLLLIGCIILCRNYLSIQVRSFSN